MNQGFYTVEENRAIADSIYLMRLSGETRSLSRPGQFINIKLDGLFLRRPISVCDYSDGSITVIYKVVGLGTEVLSKTKYGEKLDILCGLGNGFDTEKSGENPLVIGGGVGVPPLYKLAKELTLSGKKVTAILGFNKKTDVFFEKEFGEVCEKVIVATADGSYGEKGFVTDCMKDIDYSYFYTCGPEQMFSAVEKTVKTSGQFSFEERMGCGFGACMGCSCKTKYGSKRICVDGPVLEREEIIW